MSTDQQLVGREDFLGAKAKARRFDLVECPWNPDKKMRLRSLTAKEIGQYETTTLNTKKGGLVTDRLIDAKRRLLIMTAVDGSGNPFLTMSDLTSMEDTDGMIINQAYKACAKHVGISEDEVEDLVKNSGAIGGGDSASDSHSS
jgi:hypothetical protein